MATVTDTKPRVMEISTPLGRDVLLFNRMNALERIEAKRAKGSTKRAKGSSLSLSYDNGYCSGRTKLPRDR